MDEDTYDELNEKQREAAEHAEDVFDSKKKYRDASEAYRWGNVSDHHEEQMRDGVAYAQEYIKNMDMSFSDDYVDLIANATPGCDHHTSCITILPSTIAYVRRNPDATMRIEDEEYSVAEGVTRIAERLANKIDGRWIDSESPHYTGHAHIVFED